MLNPLCGSGEPKPLMFRPVGKELQRLVHRKSARNNCKQGWAEDSDLEIDMQGSSLDLPTGYYMERDPDILTLRRLDGSIVSAFSARGAAPEAVRRTVEETVQGEHSAAVQPSMQVRLFGHFEMLCEGETMPLGRNSKALTILKYLLANHTRPFSQDHLMGWLWPESNLKKARWSLNSAIHGLRKLLSGCSSSVSTNYVFLEDGYYRLSPGVRVTTDVDDFDRHHERGRRLEKDRRMREAAVEYEKAIELYRGDYLIEDLYEDWTMVERERLANAYMDMLERLAVYYKDTEQLRESIRICYRILEEDGGHENAHLLLTETYALLRSYGRALQQFRLFKGMLKSTYGTDPSVETERRFERVLGQL